MSKQHAAGLWHIGAPSADLPGFICIRGPKDVGAWSVAWTIESENARLIAAAPWLERALTDEPEDYDNHELRAVVEQIRAALSRI